MLIISVVSNHYEDTIWKQITTIPAGFTQLNLLWAIITKIQSESKSQQMCLIEVERQCCEQSLRRYNLKANHNSLRTCVSHCLLWAIITKIQSESKSQQNHAKRLYLLVVSNHYEDTIWKQITTNHRQLVWSYRLWAIITKIQSESKSQPAGMRPNDSSGCEQSLRRYNLKANHNRVWRFAFQARVVSNHYEDTIWKQITTRVRVLLLSIRLWAIITKIQSESKSQPFDLNNNNSPGCEQSLRRYNLKANHNV